MIKETTLGSGNEKNTGKHRWSLMTLLLLLGFFGQAQGWEFSFGGNKEDQGRAILQTIDRGYVTVGFSESFGTDNDIDIYAVRTDVDGTLIWQNIYDDGFIEQASEIIPVGNDGFLIVGYIQETIDSTDKVYLLRIDNRGQKRWSKTYENGGVGERAQDIKPASDGGYIIVGTTEFSPNNTDILLLKVDDDGEEMWRSILGRPVFDDSGIGVVETPNHYLIAANIQEPGSFRSDIGFFRARKTDGALLGSQIIGQAGVTELVYDLINSGSDQVVFAGIVNDFNQAFIAKADNNGDTSSLNGGWMKIIDAGPVDDDLRGVIEEPDGTISAVGSTVPDQMALTNDVLFVQLTSSGDVLQQKSIGSQNAQKFAEDLVATREGGYIIAGYNARSGVFFNDLTLYKIDGIGKLLTNQISGKVQANLDGCSTPITADDPGLSGWLIRAEKPGRVFYGTSDELGNYNVLVDTGSYMVTLIERNPYWAVCNPVAYIVDFEELYDATVNNFSVRPDISCPLLQVNVTTEPISACSEAEYQVRYCNIGPLAAENGRVEIELDKELTYLGSSLPADSVTIVNDRIIFQLGTIGMDDCGTFSFRTQVACDGILNEQAVTVKAAVFPNEDCLTDWTGGSVSVTAICDADNIVRFEIKNEGLLDLPGAEPLGYIVVEDQIMHIQGTVGPLGPSDTMQVNLQLEDTEDFASTYRIIVEQVPGHPGRSNPTIAVEGCTEEANYTTGNYTQFPEDDNDPFIDINVQEVIDYGAAVVLQGHPKGYQDSIIIPTTDLEYLLVFANTEVDTIDRIVIRDTLSSWLDLSTLEMGPSSHPYDYELYDGGILKITFDAIGLLPGGSAGEEGSHGYVKFRLSQKPNNPVGTVITNRAAVFFDYHAPQVTNEKRHIVGCIDFLNQDVNCITVDIATPSPVPGVDIKVFPNPFAETATIEVIGCTDCRELTMELHDVLGRSVRREVFSGSSLTFQRKQLPRGAYWFSLQSSGKVLGTGKMIITQ